MRKVITDKGHKVLEIEKTSLSLLNIEGHACKKCGSVNMEKIYYLPLLHEPVCKACFEAWSDGATFYPEDTLYEKQEFARLGV